MNTKIRHTLGRSLALLVAVVAAFLATNLGSSAQAVQLYGASGSPGSITPYQVQGKTVNTCAPVGTCYQRQLVVYGPTVGRSSSATAAQDVAVQYRLYRWTGSSWAKISTVNRSAYLGYAKTVRPLGVTWNVGSGYFYVQETVTWKLSSTKMVIGSRGVNYNGNDYACVNTQLSCGVNTGWLHFG